MATLAYMAHVAIPKDPLPSPESLDNPERVPFTVLLTEINSVAIRLRQRARATRSSPADLPGAAQSVLEILGRRGAMTVPQIARERSTSRQNIQMLVDRLVSQERLEFCSNPSHKKSALVRLTPGGRTLLGAGASNQKELLGELESSFSTAEMKTTLKVLRGIYDLLSKHPERTSMQKPAAGQQLTHRQKQTLPEREAVIEDFPVALL